MSQVCNCGKPTRDNAYVCDDELHTLSKRLGEVPWLVEELETTLTKQRSAGAGGSPSREKPLPLHFPAFEAEQALRTALVTWVRFCNEEGIRHQSPLDGLPTDDLVAMSRWLLWRVDGLGLSDLGWDAVSELSRAIGKVRMVIDLPPERRYAGPCDCGRDLYHRPGRTEVQCPKCERVYNVAELYEWMRNGVAGRLVTAREGATLLGRFDLAVAQDTIGKWHERKRLEGKGHNAEGHRLYLIDDLLSLAAQNVRMAG